MNRKPSCGSTKSRLLSVLRHRAQAAACIKGSGSFPDISGIVQFYQVSRGVLVYAEVRGLPKGSQPCRQRIFGFHIHKGTDCGGDREDPFANAMSHYDQNGCEHPGHAGDLPPLFGNDGAALSVFLTSRFSVEEIIGKTVIIHDHPDDFTTQPAGNAGTKIACGVIRKMNGSCLPRVL